MGTKNIELRGSLFLTYFFHDNIRDRREVGTNEEILPILRELCRIGDNVFIQEKSFDGIPFKNYVIAWRRDDWNTAHEKWKQQKWESERRKQERSGEEEQIQLIAARLINVGLEAIAYDTARKIYEQKNIPLGVALGISLDGIKWREEIQQEVHEKLPELKKENIF